MKVFFPQLRLERERVIPIEVHECQSPNSKELAATKSPGHKKQYMENSTSKRVEVDTPHIYQTCPLMISNPS